MHLRVDNVDVAAVSAALPPTSIELADLSGEFGAQEVKRICASTGINAVRVAGELTTADLCAAAARRVLEGARIDRESIEAVVVVTQTPDDLMPGVSFEVHKRLGLSHDCAVFDINHGCSGYVYGLLQAASLVSAGCRRVLLCTGDVVTKIVEPSDRKVRMVFGDAGSATIVERGAGRLDFCFWSDGRGNDVLRTPAAYGAVGTMPNRIAMDGNEVMRFALSHVPPLVEKLLRVTNVEREAVSLYGLHQANQFMVSYLTKLLGVREELVPSYLADVGNTGPSSIPLLLAARAHELPTSMGHALLCGFGVGLSIGAVLLNLSSTRFFSPHAQ